MHFNRKKRSIIRARSLALFVLGTLGVAYAVAHEGHTPLPTRGVQFDANTGYLYLSADAQDGLDVGTAVVESHAIEERVLAYATLEAPWLKHGFATTRLAGRIVRVGITPGQNISAGDPIADIESFELDNLQQELLTTRNKIRLSEKLVAELKKAAESGVTAVQNVLDAESKLAQDRNALEVSKAKWLGLDLPRNHLDDLLNRGVPIPGLTIAARSPVSGTVFHAELTAGRVVEPSDHLAEVIDLSTVWLKIGVLEKDLRKVELGQQVELRLVAYPHEVFQTTIRAISPFLDPTSHITAVWAELKNSPDGEPRFRPGMAGQASVLLANKTARPTVPTHSIIREGAERFVLVEDAKTARGSEYHKKSVTPRRESGGKVELLRGAVYPGDRVVTQGASLLGPLFAPQVLKLSLEAERTIGLTIEPVRTRAIDETIALDAAIEIPPVQRGFAAAQLSGTIRTIRVDRGQPVKAGDVLAEVYSPELLTMQEELLRVQLDTTLIVDTLPRLRASPGIAARRLWELESQENELRARSETLRRKLMRIGFTAEQITRLVKEKVLLTESPIRSPIAGVVVNFDKALGQAVSPQEPLFEIHDFSHPLVRGFVSERDTARVQPGLPVRIRLVADPQKILTGRVARSARNVAVESRSQSVWIELEDYPREPLLHNQLATAVVAVAQRSPSIAVPRSAIATEGTDSFVFVRRSDGVFDRRLVKTGPADDRWIAIADGLSPGEPIAVSGVGELMTAYASLR